MWTAKSTLFRGRLVGCDQKVTSCDQKEGKKTACYFRICSEALQCPWIAHPLRVHLRIASQLDSTRPCCSPLGSGTQRPRLFQPDIIPGSRQSLAVGSLNQNGSLLNLTHPCVWSASDRSRYSLVMPCISCHEPARHRKSFQLISGGLRA